MLRLAVSNAALLRTRILPKTLERTPTFFGRQIRQIHTAKKLLQGSIKAEKPTKQDLRWYFKNASGAFFGGVILGKGIMCGVSLGLSYCGVADLVCGLLAKYEWSRSAMDKAREIAISFLKKQGWDLSEDVVNVLVMSFVVYVVLKPVTVVVILEITRRLARRQLQRHSREAEFKQHKLHVKQQVRMFRKKKHRKQTWGQAYNHNKLRLRRTRSGFQDIKERIKNKVKDD